MMYNIMQKTKQQFYRIIIKSRPTLFKQTNNIYNRLKIILISLNFEVLKSQMKNVYKQMLIFFITNSIKPITWFNKTPYECS